MKLRNIAFGSVLVVVAGLVAAKPPSGGDLIVHEWGTFLAMDGSDGIALDGMYHEEHALPAFVHARSQEELRLPSASLKGETPVIYFYTPQEQMVRVRVDFPRGIWTQWYPQANMVGPSLVEAGSPPQLRNGHICWNVDVLPGAHVQQATWIPQTAKGALWNYARDVDASYVRTTDYTHDAQKEYERFLFYRGLGQATLPLRLTSAQDGTITWSQAAPYPIRHLFVLRVENGRGVYRYLPALAPGQTLTSVLPSMASAQPLSEFVQTVSNDLTARLVASGLYPKEARAMVNTWHNSYFETEGVRVLFVLPQEWTEAFLPMTIEPRPRELVRVMVGRLEMLTPEREKRAEQAVRRLASLDAATREHAFAYLREQGRYVEPIVRRVLRTTADPTVRTLCRRLLYTDFVTELRTTIRSAISGARLQDNPAHVRAQLASLLRQIGLETEAKTEAQSAYAALVKEPAPALTEPGSRHYLRAYARTMEGMGDDRRAADWYARLVRFGSQSSRCSGCHFFGAGPRNMAWFHDWWAGRKYAEYTARVTPIEAAIARHETTLAHHPNDTAAQLMLAYLYEAKGEKNRARTLWAQIEAPLSKSRKEARLP